MANSTLISQIKGLVTGYNTSGVKILWACEATIDHLVKHNDWTPLAWLLAKIEVPSDASLVRRIVGECLGGVVLKTRGKDALLQPSGMHIELGKNWGVTEKMDMLRKLVAAKESFRSKAVRECLFDAKEPEFDLHKYVQTVLKRLEKNEVSLADMLAEVGKIRKAESTIDVTKPESADKKLKAA